MITVGSANYRNSVTRSDDSVNHFSSRGPTRGSFLDGNGVRVVDNLLKPDLVAPGNRIVAAAATSANALSPTWNYLATNYGDALVAPLGITQNYGETQMMHERHLDGRPRRGRRRRPPAAGQPGAHSASRQGHPAVHGAAPAGLQPVQQGAGLLNIEGAVRLAMALKPDIASRIASNSVSAGDFMLANGASFPDQYSWFNDMSFNWSRMVFAGGNRVFSGSDLFVKFQPIWDPRIAWASNNVVLARDVEYWSGPGIAPNTYVKSVTESASPGLRLLTAGVRRADLLGGPSSESGRSGAFFPTAACRTCWSPATASS